MTDYPMHPLADDPIERERCPVCGSPGLLVDVVRGPEPYSTWRCELCPEPRRQAAERQTGADR